MTKGTAIYIHSMKTLIWTRATVVRFLYLFEPLTNNGFYTARIIRPARELGDF